ncbi:THUMP domain-containing class I SAM-dependent RNA methyltransferase [Aliiroseovarius sp. PTFE2010]|uniref:THUMP domain-containing class I SAM-dependent RNA methyltransferase n=1 Tax=Aliiroseovarius sp. PTFE2010 TaxID=3417190 RepID=UPI003CEE7313
MTEPTQIYLVATPGLESPLAEEARELGFDSATVSPGGVTITGGWADAMRANLWLRGATRVLVRVAEFRAMHLAQLDKRARKLPWAEWLRQDVAVRVEATCRKSRIYHDKAAAQRVARAIAETLGAPVKDKAPVTVKVRIDDDLCTISIDTTGASLHKRGHKQAVNKAPMRETMAAMFLREAGYRGDCTVYDPMCGSGTFVIEAAEIALGLAPGRARDFAFEKLAWFDAAAWESMTKAASNDTALHFHGSDRDAGAIRMSGENAARAGVEAVTSFACHPITEARPPAGQPGLIIANPPYGARLSGKAKGPLYALYGQFGDTMRDHFKGWRVALVTTDAGLAKASGLDLEPGPIVAHGGLKVRLWQCGSII